MRYELRDLSYVALAPWITAARLSQRTIMNPLNPFAYTPLGRQIAAGNELFVRLARRYEKQPFGISETTAGGERVPVREEVALAKPFCNLLHFRKATGDPGPKVLLVAPLSGHHATLLRDTVRTALPDFDVYLTDWTDAKQVPLSDGPFGFDHYVSYVMDFVRFLGPGVGVVSVCQPTVPVLAAIAVMAEAGDPATPAAMVMMGGPIDTRRNPTEVSDFAVEHPMSWFASEMIERVPDYYPGAGRNVYPGYIQWLGFVAMNPDRHSNSYFEYFRAVAAGDVAKMEAHRNFYDEYNAVLDMPAEYYLETVQLVFKEHALARGTLTFEGRRVDPAAIRSTALFTVEGEYDDISAVGQTDAAQDLCANVPDDRRERMIVPEAGHYGIFSGRRFREQVYPRIESFLRAHAPGDVALAP